MKEKSKTDLWSDPHTVFIGEILYLDCVICFKCFLTTVLSSVVNYRFWASPIGDNVLSLSFSFSPSAYFCLIYRTSDVCKLWIFAEQHSINSVNQDCLTQWGAVRNILSFSTWVSSWVCPRLNDFITYNSVSNHIWRLCKI